MTLLSRFLLQPSTQRTLNRSPGEKGFSLIELVVVIAVLAVLTAIALPNFLGVSDDASARTAQQGALNAFKECKVKWARNKRTAAEEFSVPAITDWAIVSTGPHANPLAFAGAAYNTAQPQAGAAGVKCFDANEASKDILAVPKSNKFPIYQVAASGKKYCYSGVSTSGAETYNVGCNTTANSTAVVGWQ